MSLLNDALRAAEQRQNRPELATAYTGQARSHPSQRRWLVPLLLLLIVALAAVMAYGFLTRDKAAVAVVRESEPAPLAGRILRAPPAAAAPAEAVPVSPESAESVQTEPVVEDVRPPDAPTATPLSPVVADAKPQGKVEPPAAEPVSVEPAPSVKQRRETPEAVDSRVSRELTTLLRSGESRAAEQLLETVTAVQAAPASRQVFARAMVVQQMPGRALDWLPETVTDGNPGLRLLRARALLARGDLDAALANLLRDVPPIAGYTEYRVTLATLLQQAGQSLEAARHWSALIATDDSRPAWWVGLAIALESRGESGSALKAYGQAAKLPGLSPSLADYVRERLNRLQAG